MAQLKGSCFCGALQFQVETPTKWCAHCHCSMCRKAHGAAFVTWFGVATQQFAITHGQEFLKWFPSSKEANRGFCQRCGTTLFFEGLRWSDEIHIALAVMDEPIDREPKAHVFFDSHVDWVDVGDHLKRYGGTSGTDPIEEGIANRE